MMITENLDTDNIEYDDNFSFDVHSSPPCSSSAHNNDNILTTHEIFDVEGNNFETDHQYTFEEMFEYEENDFTSEHQTEFDTSGIKLRIDNGPQTASSDSLLQTRVSKILNLRLNNS